MSMAITATSTARTAAASHNRSHCTDRPRTKGAAEPAPGTAVHAENCFRVVGHVLRP